jgi:hypothetical protein
MTSLERTTSEHRIAPREAQGRASRGARVRESAEVAPGTALGLDPAARAAPAASVLR